MYILVSLEIAAGVAPQIFVGGGTWKINKYPTSMDGNDVTKDEIIDEIQHHTEMIVKLKTKLVESSSEEYDQETDKEITDIIYDSREIISDYHQENDNKNDDKTDSQNDQNADPNLVNQGQNLFAPIEDSQEENTTDNKGYKIDMD